MGGLDFSFYNWDLVTKFLLKGLYFSLFLTVVVIRLLTRFSLIWQPVPEFRMLTACR